MRRNTSSFVALAALAFIGLISAQDPTSEGPSTANPGLPFGSFCNGLIARCNRYSDTVACLQRRADPTTTAQPSEPTPTTENPVTEVFGKKRSEVQEVCETGITVDLGRCQCQRNCKNGIYVEDGEFDPERERCVGLVGSTCSVLAPNCTKNGRCNLLTSKCVCNNGFVDDGTRRCVAQS